MAKALTAAAQVLATKGKARPIRSDRSAKGTGMRMLPRAAAVSV